MDISELKAKHKLINRWHYKWTPIDKGYTDKTLYINVGTGEIKDKPVPQVMKEKFIGGKGYGLRLLWDATRPDTRWDDPDNEIVIASGPVGGITQYSGAGKSLVVTISPQTDSVMDSNVGGFFGPFLKFSGLMPSNCRARPPMMSLFSSTGWSIMSRFSRRRLKPLTVMCLPSSSPKCSQMMNLTGRT